MNAIEFVQSIALPPPPDDDVPYSFGTEPIAPATVVGSSLVTFSDALDDEDRAGVMSAMLLAQLGAARKVKDSNDTTAWYGAYFNTLQTIGFAATERSFTEHEVTGTLVEIHQIVLEVAAASLGAASVAMVAVKKAIELVIANATGKKSPWLKLFDRHSKTEKEGHFQIVAVDKKNGVLEVSMMAYLVAFTASTTQVLFIKVGQNEARLEINKGRLVVVDNTYNAELRAALQARVSKYALDYVGSIPI